MPSDPADDAAYRATVEAINAQLAGSASGSTKRVLLSRFVRICDDALSHPMTSDQNRVMERAKRWALGEMAKP